MRRKMEIEKAEEIRDFGLWWREKILVTQSQPILASLQIVGGRNKRAL